MKSRQSLHIRYLIYGCAFFKDPHPNGEIPPPSEFCLEDFAELNQGKVEPGEMFFYRLTSCQTQGCGEFGVPVWERKDARVRRYCPECHFSLHVMPIIIKTARDDL